MDDLTEVLDQFHSEFTSFHEIDFVGTSYAKVDIDLPFVVPLRNYSNWRELRPSLPPM